MLFPSQQSPDRWRRKKLTDEQIAEARRALEDLARVLGRASANACHELGITFHMDDPQVAREVMMATFEGLVLSRPPGTEGEVKPA